MTTVLVVDTDPQTLHTLWITLTARGYQVITAADGATARRVAARARPDAVVLELDLPDIDGTEVITGLRGWTTAPIIVLSHRTDAADTVRALDVGADDYVTKPFGIPELLARLRAALRRAAGNRKHQIVDTGAFTVDLAAKQVWRDGAEVRLTPTEWRLLEILIRHEGCLVTHQQLLTQVWGPEHLTDTHYLRVYFAQLRRKLEPHPARPRHLITEPGMGYRFARSSGPAV